MKNNAIFIILIFSLFLSCSKDDTNSSDCESLIVSNGSFEDKGLVIDSIEFNGVEIKLKVGYSGCTNDHDIDLIWDGLVLETNPPQVNLLVVDNEDLEECLAFFVQEECYDLSSLLDQITSEDQMILNFYQDSTISILIDL
jgi:hypothetical protein